MRWSAAVCIVEVNADFYSYNKANTGPQTELIISTLDYSFFFLSLSFPFSSSTELNMLSYPIHTTHGIFSLPSLFNRSGEPCPPESGFKKYVDRGPNVWKTV